LAEIKKECPENLEALLPHQIQKGDILTDNHAPTEWLTDSMIFWEANNRN
ncbi:hypothetical protein ATL10_11163, partial [Bacillus sp. 196mf]